MPAVPSEGENPQSCVLLLQRGTEALLGDAQEKNSS